MSDRPRWMPSEETVLAATLGSLNVARLDKQFYNTGIAAQVQVLDELLAFFSPDGLSLAEESWLLHKAKSLRERLG